MTAVASGRVLVTATHEGVIGTIEIAVNLTQDADGDGLPDDYETANSLNPGGANLARLNGTTANASSASQPASRAIDGSVQTSWFTVVGDAANKRTVPFIEIVLPQDTNVAQLRVLGNRQNPVGFAFLSGRFQAFNAAGVEVFNSGIVNLPAPKRDLSVPVDLNGIRRVRFTSTADESNTPGLSEFQVISRPGGAGLNKNSGNDAALDFDNDGLTNLQEFQRGTSIYLNDTDSDGLDDGVEITRGTNPLLADTDNDGLSDGDEVALGTNPNKADTDGDGLPDGAEVAAGLNPFSVDSNGNGIPDGSEDSDGDGVTNFDELRENLDMNNPDSDGDGLRDGEELTPGADGYITDPRRKDTDGDGMWDGFESKYGLNPTDPSDATADPDGDGRNNLREFQDGTDPKNPDITPPSVSQITPADNATDAAVNSVIIVRFNERMQPETVVAGTIKVFEGATPVQGTVTLSSDRLSVTFAPTVRLTALADHTVQVSDLRDEAGNKMTASFNSKFKTAQFVDIDPPTVLTTAIPNGGSAVPVNSPYTVEFSEAMDPATLTTTTFRIRDNTTGIDVPGMIQVDSDRRSASFVPSTPFPVARSFTVLLTNGIKDGAGNALGGRNFSFTTAFAADTQRPQFLTGSPSPGDTAMPINALVVLQFNEPLSLVSFTKGIQVLAGSIPVVGSFALSDGNRRITFTSAAALPADTLFTVNLTSATTDLVGNPLNNPTSFTFRTGNAADLVNPTVTQLEPRNGSTNVPINSLITANFSEPVNAVTVDANAFEVRNGNTGALVPGTIAVALNRRSATLTPTGGFLGNTLYRFLNFSGITDLAGRPLTGLITVFTTAADADTTPPTVRGVSPPNGATNVQVNARVQVTFTEPIASTGLATGTVALSAGGTPVVGATSLATDGLTLTFTPTAILSTNTAYAFTLNGFTDRSGNALAALSTAFTTSNSATPDSVGPTLVSSSPANNTAAVSINTQIVLTFNEPISPASVDAVSINGSRSIRVAATVGASTVEVPASASINGAVVTLTPSSPLPPNATIQVRGPWNVYVEDLVGNSGFSSFLVQFSTATGAADTTAPTVLSVTPSANATAVGRNALVTIVFSEAIDSSTLSNALSLFNGSQRLFSTNINLSADARVVNLATTLPASSVISVAATSGIKDLSGNSLADFVSSFTTGPDSPVSGFQIVTQRPGNGAGAVTAGTPITLIANRPLNLATLAFSLFVAVNGVPITGTTQLSLDGTSIMFTPSAPFTANAFVQVFLTQDARDTSGNSLGNNYAGSFTIAPDPFTTAFQVTRINPTSFVTGNIPLNQFFDVEFNRPINPATATLANIRVSPSSTSVPLPATYSVRNGNTVRIVPSAPLLPNTSYFINVNTGLRDTQGGAYPFNSNISFFNTGTAADTLPATVSRVAPFDGATGVGTNAFIRLAFSEAINSLSITANTVSLASGVNPIPASISTSGDGLTLTMTPLSVLPPNAQIVISVNGLEDRAGNSIAPLSSTFRTGQGIDITPPAQLLTSVTSGQTGVPVNSSFSVLFNEPIDTSSINPSTLYVQDQVTGNILPGSISFTADGRTATFAPASALAIGRVYYFRNTSSIQDLAGNGSGVFFISFTASFDADTTKPQVTRSLPESGQTQIPLNGQIQVEFDEPIQPTSVASINLLAGGVPVGLARQTASGNRVVTLIPNLLLGQNTVYSLSISEVRDTSGNVMNGTVSRSFTTGPGVDVVPPLTTRATPNNATSVPRDTSVTVEFSERINPLTISRDTFKLHNANTNAIIPGAIAVAADLRSATFTPSNPLQAQTAYFCFFHSWADLAGNVGPHFFNCAFTTGDSVGATAPLVTQFTPAGASTGVPLNVSFFARFSAAMDNSTGSFLQSTPPVVGTLAWTDNFTLRFTPSSNLSPSTTYTIQIVGIRDRTGTLMTPFSANFTSGTTVDTTAPTVTTVAPTNGASAVPVAAAIVLTLNEPPEPSSIDALSINLSRSIRLSAVVGGQTVEIPASAVVTGNVVTLSPVAPLPGGVSVTVRTPWNTNIRDIAGNNLSFFQSSFTTVAGPTDATSPTVTSITPTDGSVGVGRNAPVTISFSEPVSPSTINSSTVSLFDGSSRLFPNISLGADGRNVTLNSTFQPSTTISVVVSNLVKDLFGNALAAFNSTFATAPDSFTGNVTVINQRPTGSSVPTNSPITLVFNRAMNSATTLPALRVSENGVSKIGTALLSGDGLALSFTPATPYAAGAIVQVFVRETASDAIGNQLGGLYSGIFFVVPDATLNAPFVSRFNPNSGGAIPLNQVFDFEYSEPLDPATVIAANISLRLQSTAAVVPSTVSLRNGNTTIRMVPNASLAASTGYYIASTSGLRDTGGTPPNAQNFFFTTSATAESVPPTVLAISPPAGSIAVGTNASVRIKFSEVMNAISLNAGSVQISSAGQPIPALSFSLSGDATDLTIIPGGFLPFNANVTVSVTNGAMDRAGNLVTASSSTFTTGPGPDFTAPTIISSSFFNGQTNVPVNAAPSVHFSKPMDPRTISINSVVLRDNTNSASVVGTVGLSADGRLLTFTPAANLTASRSYSFFANFNLQDLTGNVGSFSSGSFTTSASADTNAPSILASNPAPGSQVPVNARLQIAFDEPVDATSLAGIVLRQGATIRTATVQIDNTNRIVTITPAVLLASNTTYTIEIAGVRDLAGNTLAATSRSFSTLPTADLVAPAVTVTSPINGATGVSRNVQPTITFSEPLSPVVLATASVQLSGPTTINTTLSLSPDGRTLTVVPSTQLAGSSNYFLSIGSISDLAGNFSSIFLSFTTAP